LKTYLLKPVWKFMLALTGGVIVCFTVIYLNNLASKIEIAEKERLQAWQKATISRASLVKTTNTLFVKLRNEEFKKIQLWANATKRVLETENDDDRSYYLSVISSNTTIPVILTDEKNKINSWANIDSVTSKNIFDASQEELTIVKRRLEKIKDLHPPILLPYYKNLYNKIYYDNSTIYYSLKSLIAFYESSFIQDVSKNTLSVPVIATNLAGDSILFYGNVDPSKSSAALLIKETSLMDQLNAPIKLDLGGKSIFLHYKNSDIIKKIKYFPLVQLVFIGIYILVAYYLFSVSRTSEQNLIWLGMAKETAHQLGTPLSSLLGWTEILREKGLIQESNEIEKDTNRLQIITERFSKIGSAPTLIETPVNLLLRNSISYMESRIPQGIVISQKCETSTCVKANQPLFDWVVENMIKNAVDAIPNGKGSISFKVSAHSHSLQIDITDSGKGIPKSIQKRIFDTGFTTKARGWGLGLSLTKRIIEQYHKGSLFVKSSELGKGTTFRIVLKKQ